MTDEIKSWEPKDLEIQTLKSTVDQLITENQELEDIIERHQLNRMPLEIKALEESLVQEKRNVLDLARKVNALAKLKHVETVVPGVHRYEIEGQAIENYIDDHHSMKQQLEEQKRFCAISGCVNFDESFKNNCSLYKWVECCVDCSPYGWRFREQKGE